VNKGRDKRAERLKGGNLTEQKFRSMIVCEIDDIKSKLDGLSRKDLLASISFFEEGIELLYEVFDKARSRSEGDEEPVEATCAEAFNLISPKKYETWSLLVWMNQLRGPLPTQRRDSKRLAGKQQELLKMKL